ncbi:MAG TPA: hypothetical protein VEW46_13635 [Pyrinomonadaceae bacterium]|nr:hypothetical protein [Pyrinomonadaceae bacterium]
MGEKTSAQTPNERLIVESLDREFARLHVRSCAIVEKMTDETLYSSNPGATSVGDSILRCAAEIEQTFGGVTANLWDDPFEWTLPEQLSTRSKVLEHLGEVEALRQRAFTSFSDDACLSKHVATPSTGTQPLIELLLKTLLRASDHQSQARATLR